MLPIILSICALIAAVLTIRASLTHAARQEYAFKPLTMVFIILIAVLEDDPVSSTYQVLIVLALLVSLVGDVLLMLPDEKYFMPGLISFLVAHLVYIAVFTLESTGTPPIWYILPFLLYGVVVLRVLWRDLGPMRPAVMVYVGAIMIMAWQAANRWIATDTDGALLAMVGAYLFVASDSALAVERFKGAFRSAPIWVLSTYFAAQWLIALSV